MWAWEDSGVPDAGKCPGAVECISGRAMWRNARGGSDERVPGGESGLSSHARRTEVTE